MIFKEMDYKDRKRTYGCNGICYGGTDKNGVEHPMCERAWYCDETENERELGYVIISTVILISFVVALALCDLFAHQLIMLGISHFM